MPKDSKKAKGFGKKKPDNQIGEIKSREVFDRLLDASLKGQDEVYRLLEQYQDYMTDGFALMVREEAAMKLRRLGGTQKLNLLGKLYRLNYDIYKFPKGNQASQIEIVIAINEVLIKFVNRFAFPPLWASLQNGLGNSYYDRIRGDRTDNLELAIAAYQNALEIRTHETFPEAWAITQNSLGIAYTEQAKFSLAMTAYQNALEIRTREAFPEAWAMTQNSLGIAYTEQGKFDLASTSYKTALEIRTREAFPENWANTQNNLGDTYCRAGKYQEAIACLKASLEIRTREEFPEDWAMSQYNLAIAYSGLGNLNQAFTYFRFSLEIFAPTAFPSRRLQSGRDFGKAAFDAEKWQVAIEGYIAAIEAVEVICSWASNNQHRSEILQEEIDVYTQAVQACLNDNQPELAVEYVERSKARNLVQLFADLDNKSNKVNSNILNHLERLKKEIRGKQQELDNIPKDFGQKIKSIVSNVVEHFFSESDETEFTDQPTNNEEQSDTVTNDNSPNPNQLYAQKLRIELEDLQEEFDEVLEEIIELDPVYALTQAVQPIRYQEIIAQLEDRTAIIEWYLTEQGFYTFLITKESEKPEFWQFVKDELEQLNQWQQAYLEDYNKHKYFQWKDALTTRLEELANILHLQEILDKIPENCNQLILVPHRYLHLLPLHALPINTNDCLLNRFSQGIRYAPSCQLLQLSQKRSSVDNSNEIAKNFFAIQNPTEDLNFANVEVETIRQYFDKNYVLAQKQATKSKWNKNQTKKDLKSSNFVHFSCHSYFNFDEPLSSPLVLSGSSVSKTSLSSNESLRFISPDQQSYNLGQCLLLKEIFNLDLFPCRLVTLSACETGLSNPENWGDEYIGLPSGFLVAGSPSVVGSQWAVSDISTAILMIKFYENLMTQFESGTINNLNQLSVSKALNSAQLWLRSVTKTDLLAWIEKFDLDAERQKELERDLRLAANDQPYAEPIYWAAFCAIGQ
ncbi:MAG: CHAT domain-containing tetratricopeptide repeat protein [Cyanobacteria bacterium P01_F01_bin.143]